MIKALSIYVCRLGQTATCDLQLIGHVLQSSGFVLEYGARVRAHQTGALVRSGR